MGNLKRWSLLECFICSWYINYWEGLDWCKISSGIEAEKVSCNPRFCLEWPHSKCKDGSKEEVLQKPPDFAAFAHEQMQMHL